MSFEILLARGHWDFTRRVVSLPLDARTPEERRLGLRIAGDPYEDLTVTLSLRRTNAQDRSAVAREWSFRQEPTPIPAYRSTPEEDATFRRLQRDFAIRHGLPPSTPEPAAPEQ